MSPEGGRTPPAGAIELRVEKLIGGGRGLAHHDGRTWMVAAALPGERVLAAPDQDRAGVTLARAIAVRGGAHPARLGDPCPHAGGCGGCDWPHVDAASGAALKPAIAAEAGRRSPELAERLLAAPATSSPLSYRLRARLHWDPGRRLLGFYGPRSWTVADIPACRIVSRRLAAARHGLTGALAASCPEPVDLEWLEDLEGETAIAALRPSRGGPDRIERSWIPSPAAVGGEVTGFWSLNATGHPDDGWGNATVTMGLPIPLKVPIGAFFQVNRHLARWLFERVAALTGPEPVPVFDLHAGVGFLAAAARTAADRDLSLAEPHRGAALAARRNLPDARVAVGTTAEAFLGRRRRLPRRALVLLDPPRAGLSVALRRRLTEWRPERVLMLSCDPATWARDAAHLCDHGFELVHLELADLFPSTHHVEILSVLAAP